ncbi:MAG TPA: hypothetical protein VJP59_08015 [Gemmatimonadota bacterium]|nr:hypothetical protein [Gemmatimonadota bacterium]
MAVSSKALIPSLLLGTLLQVGMVVVGHNTVAVASLFAPLGMAISLIAGFLYGRWARSTRGSAVLGGAIVGGLSAVIGIAVSHFLGDVQAWVLFLGTLSATFTGAIGGLIGHTVGGQAPAGA